MISTDFHDVWHTVVTFTWLVMVNVHAKVTFMYIEECSHTMSGAMTIV